MSALAPIFKAHTSQHWIAALLNHGVPAGPIYRIDEMFDDPQVRHLGMAGPITHPELGEIRLVAQPLDLSRTPAQLVEPAPEPGAHTEEVLTEAGFDRHAIDEMRRQRVV